MMGDKDVSWCLKFLTDLCGASRRSGYVYTELHDIEWEHNGIYNYDGSATSSATTGGPAGRPVPPRGRARGDC